MDTKGRLRDPLTQLLLAFVVVVLGVLGLLVRGTQVSSVLTAVNVVLFGFVLYRWTGRVGAVVLAASLVAIGFLVTSGAFLETMAEGASGFVRFLKNLGFDVDVAVDTWGDEFGEESDAGPLSLYSYLNEATTVALRGDIRMRFKGDLYVQLDESDVVEVPAGVYVRTDPDGTLFLRGERKNRKYNLRLGTKGLAKLHVDSVFLSLHGKSSERISDVYISCLDARLDCDLNAKDLVVNGNDVKVVGSLSGDEFTVKSVDLELNSRISFEKVNLNAVDVNLNLELERCSEFDVSSVDLSGVVVYRGGKDLELRLRGVGGSVTVRNLSNNRIDVNSSGVTVRNERGGI